MVGYDGDHELSRLRACSCSCELTLLLDRGKDFPATLAISYLKRVFNSLNTCISALCFTLLPEIKRPCLPERLGRTLERHVTVVF
jgi:hypothetical protein